MNANALFDFGGWGDPLEPYYQQLATALNDGDISHKEACHSLFEARAKDAESRDWVRERLASSVNLCRKRVQELVNNSSGNGRPQSVHDKLNLLALLVDGLTRETPPLTLLQARERLSEKFQKANEYDCCPVRNDEAMRAILREGVSKGVLNEVVEQRGRRKERVYFVTEKSLIRPRAETKEDRAGVAGRANRIVRRVLPKNALSIPATLSLAGVQKLLSEVVNPGKRFRPIWDFIDLQEPRAKDRTKQNGREPEDNFGTCVSLCVATDELNADADQIAPLSWAISYSVANMAEVWPLTFHVDKKARTAFSKAWPIIAQRFREQVADAENLSKGDSHRRSFVMSIAWARF